MPKLIITFLGLALAFGALAQTITQEVVFSLSNGGNPVNTLTFTVEFPKTISPARLTPAMTWDAQKRTLSISIPKIGPYEKVNLPVTVIGEAGQYKIQGKLKGQWTEIGQTFESAPITTAVEIKGPTKETIVERVRNIPELAGALKNVGAPAAAALGAVGTGALVSNVVSTNAGLAINFLQALRFFGFGLFRWRRPKPWGKIYNQLTRRPIKGATVKIFDFTFQKVKDTQYTDAEGRFGFIVSPGTYYLIVSHNGFKEVKTDPITITGSEGAVNLEIPMLSETGFLSQTKPFWKFLSAITKFINKINPWLLAFGTLLSLFMAVVLPSTFNTVVLGAYIFIDLWKLSLASQSLKSSGQVLDSLTKRPLELAIVRIYDAEKSWLLSSRVTDRNGRFKFLVIAGSYYVACVKNGYQPYTSQPATITRAGIITWDINLEPTV